MEDSITTKDIPSELAKFCHAMRYSELKTALQRLHDHAVMLPDHHDKELLKLSIPIGLYYLLKRRRVSKQWSKVLDDEWAIEALSFIAYFNRLYDRLSSPAKNRFRKDTLSRFRVSNDIRPLAHELTAGFYFASRGFNVSFSDLDGEENFDLLCEKESLAIEVEVKTVTSETGTSLNREHILRFVDRLLVFSDGIEIEESFDIHIDLSGKFPKSDIEQRNLDASVRRSITEQCDVVEQDVAIRYLKKDSFVFHGTDFEKKRALINLANEEREKGNQVFATLVGQHLVRVIVSSERHNQLLSEIVDRCKKASRQLTTRRPGVVWLSIVGVNSSELNLDEVPHPFDYVAYECFKHNRRSHVSAIIFSAEGNLQTRARKQGTSASSILHRSMLRYNTQAKVDVSKLL